MHFNWHEDWQTPFVFAYPPDRWRVSYFVWWYPSKNVRRYTINYVSFLNRTWRIFISSRLGSHNLTKFYVMSQKNGMWFHSQSHEAKQWHLMSYNATNCHTISYDLMYRKNSHIRTYSYGLSLLRFLLAIHNLAKCCIREVK